MSILTKYFEVSSETDCTTLLYLHCGVTIHSEGDSSHQSTLLDHYTALHPDIPLMTGKRLCKEAFVSLMECAWADSLIRPFFTEKTLLDIIWLLLDWPREGELHMCNTVTKRLVYKLLYLLDSHFGTDEVWTMFQSHQEMGSLFPQGKLRMLLPQFRPSHLLAIAVVNKGSMDMYMSLDVAQAFDFKENSLQMTLAMVLVEGLVFHGSLRHAEHFIDQISSTWRICPSLGIYVTLFKAYARQNEFMNAYQIFWFMHGRWWPLPRNIYTLMLKLYQLELRAFQRQQLSPRTVFSVNADGKYPIGDKIHPNLPLCGPINYDDQSLHDGARKLLHAINDAGIRKNTQMYSIMIDVHAAMGEFPHAMELFQEMRQSPAYIKFPSPIVYSIIIEAVIKWVPDKNSMTVPNSNGACQYDDGFPHWHPSMSVFDTLNMLLTDMARQKLQPNIQIVMGVLKWHMLHGEVKNTVNMISLMLLDTKNVGDGYNNNNNNSLGSQFISSRLVLDLPFYDMCILWALQTKETELVKDLVHHAHCHGIDLAVNEH
ncbi:hypothetical protein BASA61_006495 [Batrachochytrium salamandrivorans]|nr:hypothetical protein BASA62_009250 [Batrachochytrium salamandrivorans]KAH6586627.1 hypothetical protein BASA61_006495 [Batrachochytrium salamandrivorans]